MTIDEWSALPEDEPGELVDGVIVEDEVTSWIHETVVTFFIEVFRAWARPRGGFVAGSDVKLAVSPGRGRKPDVAVVLPGSPKPPGRASLLTSPPDLVVEVVSDRPRDARRDRVEKLVEYAAFGVRYYWIIDPQLRTVEVYELEEARRYARALSATGGVLREIPGCPDLVVDLDVLWADVSELEAD
jgi:Uma2 family endonuclease